MKNVAVEPSELAGCGCGCSWKFLLTGSHKEQDLNGLHPLKGRVAHPLQQEESGLSTSAFHPHKSLALEQISLRASVYP